MIFLWGMPAAGKSSIGRILAEELGWDFIDLDVFIVSFAKKSIPSIFEEESESGFRGYEYKALLKILQKHDNLVVACGGGTPCMNQAFELMMQNGICVYIKNSLDILQQRLLTDNSIRPLLKEKSSKEIRQWLEENYSVRHPIYLQAHFVFEGQANSIRDECHNLKAQLEQMGVLGV